MTGRGIPARVTNDDLHITTQARQAAQHLRFADTIELSAELSAQHYRQLRLCHAKYLGGMLLRLVSALDELAAFHRELRLDEHFVGACQNKVSADITTAFLDRTYVSSPMAACAYTILNGYIKFSPEWTK